MNYYYYRPQTKFAKVMFSQVSVCPRGGGGVCLWSRGGVCHTPQADTPGADTPLGRHPLPSACWDTPPTQCMLGYTPHPTPAQCMLGYTPPLPSACWDTQPPAQCMLGYSQQAGGTHPTGMHSCCIINVYRTGKSTHITQLFLCKRGHFVSGN